ncbi:MAG TPA: NAD(P)H-dependent oxidoreductase subunit E [Solirubrobacterales bacterium]|nr:NAD(P)H-dependent oxidoreductase subunit E [Solirubrobacterales bacterium]
MSPLLPKGRRPWLDDPGHIHDSPTTPPMPDEQEELAPDDTLATTPVRRGPEGEEIIHEPRGADQEPAGVPDLNEVDVPGELAETIRRAMDRYPEKRSASIPALWAVQKRYGYCSPEGIRQAAAVMGVTPGYLQAVASFYDLFHLEPQGEHEVLVCTNISCWLRGGDDVLGAFIEAAGVSGPGETSEDGTVYVRGFECLGACDIAPMASIDSRYYGPLETADAAKVLEQLRGGADVLPDKRLQDRGVAGGPGAKEIPDG